MRSVVHIVGPAITVGGRVVQRCSLCGEKLVDSKGMASPLNDDGTCDQVSTWEVGRLIRVVRLDEFTTRTTLLDDTDKLPDDSCLELIE